MPNLHTAPVGVKGQIAYFFRQTFRRHSGAEYSELFTRGMRGMKGVNRKYPWAYIRLFGLLFILFAVYLLVVRFTSNDLFAPTITMLAGFLFNFSFLILIYELYPQKDLALMSVLLAMLLGGAGANIVSQILYNIFPTSDKWLKAVLSGFFEELPKAIAVVFVIIGAKRHSPLAGFVLGAAVGCGFSVVEDMGYIFMMSDKLPVMNLTAIINVSISRGLTAFCTHILWSAAIGWGYNILNKWLSNLAFWLTIFLSCGLHICWNLPLGTLALAFVYAGCVVIVATECILILSRERKKVFDGVAKPAFVPAAENEQLTFLSDGQAVGAECAVAASAQITEGVQVAEEKKTFVEVVEENKKYYEEDALSLNSSTYKYWRHWGHLCCMLGAFLMAVVGVIYCSIPYSETYGTKKFKSGEELAYYMQDGYELDYDEHRAFVEGDETTTPSGEYTLQIVKDTITKGEESREVVYQYLYSSAYNPISGKVSYYLFKVSMVIFDGDAEKSCNLEKLYNSGVEYASYFILTDDVISGYNFNTDGSITVFVHYADFVRDLTAWEYASFFIALGVIAAATAICYISFKIKSWRIKKQCLTINASSVK